MSSTSSFPGAMGLDAVVRYLRLFDELGLTVWLDGGWGVDALLGEQTRPHLDLDIVIQQGEVEILRRALAKEGFSLAATDDQSPWNFVMADSTGHRIDFHVITFDEKGHGIYGPPAAGAFYPKEALRGRGKVGEREVRCLTARYQLASHTGYPLRAVDVDDVRALCDHFGLEPPEEYRHHIREDGPSNAAGCS